MDSEWEVLTTPEFDEWLNDQTEKQYRQISNRVSKIGQGYFGNYKSVSPDNIIWELKWENGRRNGRRIYYTYIKELQILLLLGGNKNGQAKDIARSRQIYKRWQATIQFT